MKALLKPMLAAALLTGAVAAQTPATPGLAKVAADFQERLDRATLELAQYRKEVEAEKVPLTRKLAELEEQIVAARKEYDQVIRLRDSRTLDVTNLKAQTKSREDSANYMSNLMDEFSRNAEGRLHQTESERYGEIIESKRNAALNANLSLNEKLQARLDLFDLFANRLESGLGGELFDGAAVNGKTGVVSQGKVLLLGPIGYFSTEDGSARGIADSQLNSASTVVLELPLEVPAEPITKTLFAGEGVLPFDPTRGSAFKVEETKLSVADQFRKGGPVMYPIGALGVVAVVIGLLKWLQLALVKRPSNKRVKKFLAALDAGDVTEANVNIQKVGGPVGRMLKAAATHYADPPTMMEESMFEAVLDARAKLNSWIPFIKIAAAVEPLLGLLGTVTGMINTFNLITIFGTGDASTFSSGISEALLTTMWGLVTAIPCLLMAAFLARKARAALDDMEKLAVRLMNHRNHQETIKIRGAEPGDGPPSIAPTAGSRFENLPALPAAGAEAGGAEGLTPSPA
jgi:biopolymer transport protein ExbB